MPLPSTFADHFPLERAANSSQAHQKIDADLRNCDSLWPNAPMGLLFPGCSAASSAERQTWFPAALERLEWNCESRLPDSGKWLAYLTSLLQILAHDAGRIDEGSLLRLAKYGPRLHSRAQFHNLTSVIATALAERKEPLTPELGDALDSLAGHLTRIHDHSPKTFEIAFRLFREGWSPIPWISASDLNSPKWSALLDLSDHYYQGSSIASGKPAARVAAAIAKIGEPQVSAFIDQTVDGMEACQPVPMNAAGMTMLRQILRWIQSKPELPVDEALYRLCGIRWEPAVTETGLMKEWLGTLLQTLAQRSRERAFACVERLANNPDTKSFREVVGLYEQFMHEMLRDVPAAPTTGVDGFPLTSEMDRILDSFLRASVPRPYTFGDTAVQSTSTGRSEHFQLALRQCENDYPSMLRAMNERVQWLAKHEPPTTPGQGRPMPWLAWCCDLGKLYCNILDRKPALDAADLVALCGIDSLGWLGIGPTGPLFNACQAWISKNGFDPQLSKAMEEWQKHVYGGGTATALRKQIGWLLWFDTSSAINEKTCWSALIRKDLRAMAPEVAGAWIALLGNVSVAIAEKPTKKWLKPAEKLLRSVGAEEFQTRVRAWFAPFQAGRDLRITIAGRDILGALFWYSQLAKDPKVDEAVRWFGAAKWKSKADRDRTARLLPIWIHTMVERSPEQALDAIHQYHGTGQLELLGTSMELYDELCRRYGRAPQIAAPPPPPPLDKDSMMAKMMQKTMSGFLGDSAKVAGDSVVVKNTATGESYEIGLRDGRIVRASDGKTVRLEIDWTRPPFSHFKSMIDGGDLANPFGRNYFRAMLCAQVLSGALATNVPIVVDES